jgi:hypothetical protein
VFQETVIDGLQPTDKFRIVTPFGSFEMTKEDFERDFPNVRESDSYKQAGIYQYPKIPAKAERYRSSD